MLRPPGRGPVRGPAVRSIRLGNSLAQAKPSTSAIPRWKALENWRWPDGTIVGAHGANSDIVVYEDRVRLAHSGIRSFVGTDWARVRRDSLSQISSVQARPRTLWLGFIAFSILGGTDPSGGVFDATQRENAVTFDQVQQPAFRARTCRGSVFVCVGARAPLRYQWRPDRRVIRGRLRWSDGPSFESLMTQGAAPAAVSRSRTSL